MVKLFVVLGLALLVGGAYAIFDGWPYRVLERGFTEVILGALSFAAGLLLLAAAAILAEVHRLKTLVASAVTAVSLNAVRHDERAPAPTPVPMPEPIVPEPIMPREEIRPSQPGIGGAAVAAGAGAIALGGAPTGLSKPERPADEDERYESVAEQAAPPASVVEEEASPKPEPAAALDDWLRPPALVRETDPEIPAERIEPDFFEAALLPTPVPEPALDLRDEPAVKVPEPENDDLPETDPVSDNQAELALEPEPEAVEVEPKLDDISAETDPLWWPQIDRGVGAGTPAAKASSDYDDFSALREQLTDALGKPGAAPEVEPPRRSLDAVSDWMAPRPWPPVTQPRSNDALDALEEPAAAADAVPPRPEEAADATPELVEEKLPPEPAEKDELEPAVEPEAQAAVPELVPDVEEPAAPEAEVPAREADKPSASDEGIVGAYQVGETHFTIYADGSIQARTPDGDYVFGSMDELKAYLASEKSRLESGHR